MDRFRFRDRWIVTARQSPGRTVFAVVLGLPALLFGLAGLVAGEWVLAICGSITGLLLLYAGIGGRLMPARLVLSPEFMELSHGHLTRRVPVRKVVRFLQTEDFDSTALGIRVLARWDQTLLDIRGPVIASLQDLVELSSLLRTLYPQVPIAADERVSRRLVELESISEA